MLARKLATELDFILLDSGLLYRAYSYCFDKEKNHDSAMNFFSQLTIEGVAGEMEVFEGNNNIIDPLNLTLDYNYNKQNAGELINDVENISLQVGAETVEIPNTLSAYYGLDSKTGKPYKVFDAGVSAGAAFFLNGGLYFSAIANYGLIDVTNSDLDFSNTDITGFDFNTRDDKDKNLSFQFSLGFSF